MSGSGGEKRSVAIELIEERGRREGSSTLCVDPVTKMVVLRQGKEGFQMINPLFISDVEGSLAASEGEFAIEGLDVQSIDKREALAHKNAGIS